MQLRCFLINFTRFLGTPFLQNISGRLLLNMTYSDFQVNKFFEASVIICWWRKLSTDSAYNASWDNNSFSVTKHLVVVNQWRVLVVYHWLYTKTFYEKNLNLNTNKQIKTMCNLLILILLIHLFKKEIFIVLFYNVGIKVNKWIGSINERKKNWVQVCWKIKNMKINCTVAHIKNELLIVTKKITNFNAISFTSAKLFL